MLPVRPTGYRGVVRPTNRLETLFDRMFEDVDRAIGTVAGGRGPTPAPAPAAVEIVPMAIWEDEDHFGFEFEVPGIAQDALELTVHDGRLYLRGERAPAAGRTYLYNGRTFGRFERFVALPDLADPERVEAALTDGVLSLRFARRSPGGSPSAPPRRHPRRRRASRPGADAGRSRAAKPSRPRRRCPRARRRRHWPAPEALV
jgi:HSP20 family protein